ncbi:universal stress protein family [Azotobacter vinelandii CA]|uniref:Universal stress protein family n=2 Tax=Azotobacter vinelandii TaxID=354 RepID=C1DDN9_AZOVD|nr:universal stress protein [Azotobacter vinelandii]ACO78010.1 universal stress protein family [Azotobacter vinelandii DJ]AGK15174.1 universal stress protein family [Azotobacter vinelandii CA]AGK20168.1 universal stress protein family [Azotobacter vinelandii CA6]WKN23734.1 universal stress protein [Azotobacter vinelandii]SFX91577.1 Nucleotide-binding universal stress protein, UspA family [Azotobacter vinelandii]
MKKVLVPFDGSESAKRALLYLVELVKRLPDLEIHLLNVQGHPIMYGDYVAGPMLESLVNAAREHGRKINAKGVELLRAHGLEATAHEELGETVGEIAKAVALLGCDLVVMGTRGMTNFSNLIMGSVSTRVVHEVAVPVLLIK